METLRTAILEVLGEDPPMTLRQLFYQLVIRGHIEKTEQQYDAIGRQCGLMRIEGALPWEYITDNTRWMRKPDTYSGAAAALRDVGKYYRRSLWAESPVYVEIWIEKDTLAGILYDVTSTWDVPLMVSRGFASLSYIHEAAEAIEDKEKPAFIYYFGDHDPSGLSIDASIENRLRQFAPDAEIHFERVAVTPKQIKQLNLPTRPTKKTDTRAKGFQGDSVEVDAIRPKYLKWLAERCIRQHVDNDVYERALVGERAERDTILQLAKTLDGKHK